MTRSARVGRGAGVVICTASLTEVIVVSGELRSGRFVTEFGVADRDDVTVRQRMSRRNSVVVDECAIR